MTEKEIPDYILQYLATLVPLITEIPILNIRETMQKIQTMHIFTLVSIREWTTRCYATLNSPNVSGVSDTRHWMAGILQNTKRDASARLDTRISEWSSAIKDDGQDTVIILKLQGGGTTTPSISKGVLDLHIVLPERQVLFMEDSYCCHLRTMWRYPETRRWTHNPSIMARRLRQKLRVC